MIFSLNYTDRDFDAVADRFVAAAKAMQQDGWWWCDPATTNKSIKRRILKEMIAHRLAARHRSWSILLESAPFGLKPMPHRRCAPSPRLRGEVRSEGDSRSARIAEGLPHPTAHSASKTRVNALAGGRLLPANGGRVKQCCRPD